MTYQAPPSVAGHWLYGNLTDFRANSLKFIEKAATVDDIVTIRFGMFKGYFVNHPDFVGQILRSQHQSFRKPRVVRRALADITGTNIFTSNGDFWRNRRKMMQPMFHAQRIKTYTDIMVEESQSEIAAWQPQQAFDLDTAMTRLTMKVITRTMFSHEVDDKTKQLGDIFFELFQLVYGRMSYYALIPAWLPTPANRKVKQLTAIIRTMLQNMIDERRQTATQYDDLLSMLMEARTEDNEPLSDEAIIREALTIFGAGYETTAYATVFTFYLLAQNPDVAQKLYNEVDTVIGERTLRFADISNLTYTEMVIKEALRLYPTAWGFARQTQEDVTLGDYHIPENSIILISPWTLGRDARWFNNPTQFSPERFDNEHSSSFPRNAYIPFGGGKRVCMGNMFSMLEMRVILATVTQEYRLAIESGFETEVHNAAFTLRPTHGMRMVAHKRLPVSIRETAVQSK